MISPLKLFSRFSVTSAALLFVGCDGGSPESVSTTQDNLVITRGLSTENPAGTPGFPFSIGPGDRITFTPDVVEAGGFLEQVPLGVWETEASNFMRQTSTDTGSLYFPVNENTFRYFYTTSTNPDPTVISTQDTALLSYSFEHRFTRIGDYIPRMLRLANASLEPGGFGFSTTSAILVTDQERLQVEILASIGIAAVDYPNVGAAVRRGRLIELTGITSTNADLEGDNPFIAGTYTVTDTWHTTISRGLNLLFDPITQADITFPEISTGTFILELNGLPQPR